MTIIVELRDIDKTDEDVNICLKCFFKTYHLTVMLIQRYGW